METSPARPSASPVSPSGPWTFPAWLEPRLLPDARFARAYERTGDQRRALLKGLIADHYALNPPASARRTDCLRH